MDSLKFLVSSFWDTEMACINYLVVSFNWILMQYHCKMVSEMADARILPNDCCLLSTYLDNYSNKFAKVQDYYESNNKEGLKKLLFGSSDSIELYIESGILGVMADGKQLVVHTKGWDLHFKKEDAKFTGSSRYDKIRAKLDIAGKKLSFSTFDSYYATNDVNCLKYLGSSDCIALKDKDINNFNGIFNNVCLGVTSLIYCSNIKINSLVQAYIGITKNCSIDIRNTLFVDWYDIEGSRINFGNVQYIKLRNIINSTVEFDRINNIEFMTNAILKNSRIEFRCNYIENEFIEGLRECLTIDKVVFAFKQGVNIDILIELVDLLESAIIDASFKIELTSEDYEECMHSLDTKYIRYLIIEGSSSGK